MVEETPVVDKYEFIRSQLIEGLDRKILFLYRPTAKSIVKLDRKKVVMKFNDNLDSNSSEGL
jgi:hypothetical protein